MPLVLDVKLAQNGVFFGGEMFSCSLTFSHESNSAFSTGISSQQGSVPALHAPEDKAFIELMDSISLSDLQGGPPQTLKKAHSAQAIMSAKDAKLESALRQSPLAHCLSAHELTGNPFDHDLDLFKRRRQISEASDCTSVASDDSLISQGRHCQVEPESFMYGYAQLYGEMVIDGTLLATKAFEPLKSKPMYRPGSGSNLNSSLGGGGSMTCLNSVPTIGNKDNSIPVFSTPPTILFTNLSLPYGSKRTYKYQIMLPDAIPPTHRGRALRFSYKLIIGTQRNTKEGNKTSFDTIPFRIFNSIDDRGLPAFYDVMAPIANNTDEAVVILKEEEIKRRRRKKKELTANRLLASIKRGDSEQFLHSMFEEQPQNLPLVNPGRTGKSLNNIVGLFQTSSACSYEICKNNEKVAKVTLHKTSYRLGDTINAVINFAGCAVWCYQISVTLESVEKIEAPFAVKPKDTAYLTRKIHSEHHEFTLNMRKTFVSLLIPVTSSPTFSTSAANHAWNLRVEFITGVKHRKLESIVRDNIFSYIHGADVSQVEVFDCLIPLQVFPTAPEVGNLFHASKSILLL